MPGKVLFDVQHLYYLPQYIPVARILLKAGILCEFVLHQELGLDALKQEVIEKEGFRFQFIANKAETLSLYSKSDADWIVFGNRPYFNADQKKSISLLALRLCCMASALKHVITMSLNFPSMSGLLKGKVALND